MTISSTYAPVQYNGNGVTTVFAFPYEFYNSTDLIVKSTVILTGVTTTLTITTDYTVSGGNGSTGNVTFVSAPASTVRITIERAIPYTQTQDYQENTAFPAATLETGLDKAVVMAQQAKAAADLALKFPATDPSASRGEIPNSVSRANAILSFDANGAPSAVTLASLGASINVSLTSPQNGDVMTYNAGSWLNRSVLASLGTNIASAATTNLGSADSDFVTITGTTGITSFGTPASLSRKHIWAVFAGAVTITHNATTLILPGAANYTTSAGDVLECVHISGANWRVVGITRSNGAPLPGAVFYTNLATADVASTSDLSAGTASKIASASAMSPLMYSTKAYQTTGVSIPANTWTDVTFDSEEWDDANWHSTSANTNRITVDFTGRVQVIANYAANSTSNTNVGIRIQKNGVTVARSLNAAPASSSELHQCVLAAEVPVTPGDYVNIQVYQNTGGAVTSGTGTAGTSLTVRRIK